MLRDTARVLAQRIFDASLGAESVDPRALARAAAARLAGDPVMLLGAGKAAFALAAGVADAVPVASGFVVGKEPGPPVPPAVTTALAGHPWPDLRSLSAGHELLARAAGATGRLVVVWSGGASALAAVPAPGVSLAEKDAVTRELAAGGADIQALNRVRRAMSALKGGRLARVTQAPVDALLLSDVIGDPPHVIGGGALAAPPPGEPSALATLAAAGVTVPARLRDAIAANEAAAPRAADLAHVRVRILAGPDSLLAAAVAACARAGVEVAATHPRVTGDALALADELVAAASEAAETAAETPGPRAYLAGGEPTLALSPRPGRGGRAQHVALAAALGLARAKLTADVAILCAASDGSDGPTADAGGLVDAGTAGRAAAAGHDPAASLAACDAGNALAAAGDLLTTGPTGNNLCDLYVVVVSRR